jgi:hypothetical protein
MSTDLAERRRGRVTTLFMAAAALVVVAAVTLGIEYRSANSDAVGGFVVPGLSETIEGAQRITVTSADVTYRIERTARGWVMRDRDDYPVLESRLEQLAAGLEQLRYVRRMTGDASKHERLGVTDPREGGRGILLTIEDGRGALLVNLILGVETSGTYARAPDDAQTWSVRGELAPLRDVATWMDLRPLELVPDQLTRVEISPPQGRAYILARDSAEAPWRLVAPAIGTPEGVDLSGVAEQLAGVQPVDVRTAPAISGPVRSRVRALTVDGVVIDGEVVDADGRLWLKLVARAAAPEQEEGALAVNNRAAAWAYALSEADAAALTPPLSSVLPSPDQ